MKRKRNPLAVVGTASLFLRALPFTQKITRHAPMITLDLADEKSLTPEQRLWKEVCLRAIRDLLLEKEGRTKYQKISNEYEKYFADAGRFFLDPSSSFAEAIEALDMPGWKVEKLRNFARQRLNYIVSNEKTEYE